MCIHAGAFGFLYWVVEFKIQNEFKIFGNKLENGFETKEKKDKRELGNERI